MFMPMTIQAILKVRVTSRSIPPRWGSIRVRLAHRAYDAPPWVVRVASLIITESRKIPTRRTLCSFLCRGQDANFTPPWWVQNHGSCLDGNGVITRDREDGGNNNDNKANAKAGADEPAVLRTFAEYVRVQTRSHVQHDTVGHSGGG